MRSIMTGKVGVLLLRLAFLELLAMLFGWNRAAADVQAQAPVLCSAPATAEEAARCDALEQQVLDATVFLRFTMRCGPHGNRSGRALVASHATVVDNRTLLTHDHFSRLADPDCDAGSLEVIAARGGLLAEIEGRLCWLPWSSSCAPIRGPQAARRACLTFPMLMFMPAVEHALRALRCSGDRCRAGSVGRAGRSQLEPVPETDVCAVGAAGVDGCAGRRFGIWSWRSGSKSALPAAVSSGWSKAGCNMSGTCGERGKRRMPAWSL